MHFGATLRLLRSEAGISLRALARAIGVSGAYLSRVENGHDSPPTPDRLVAIARVLGLPPTALFDLAHQISPLVGSYLHHVPAASVLFLEIARRRLSPAQLARVQNFIDENFGDGKRTSLPLSTILSNDGIVLDLHCGCIEDVFDIAATRLADPARSLPAITLSQLLSTREHEASTSIGDGFAVPCVRVPGVPTRAAFIRLAKPITRNTADGKPLRAVFVLAFGDDHPQPMPVLAQIARLLDSHGEALMAATSPKQMLEILHAFDRVAA